MEGIFLFLQLIFIEYMNNHSYNLSMETKQINDIETLFKVIADKTRLEILISLLDGEKCVCMIAKELGISHSLASHQLSFLKKSKLVDSRKEKRHCFYWLKDEHVNKLLEIAFEHVSEVEDD